MSELGQAVVEFMTIHFYMVGPRSEACLLLFQAMNRSILVVKQQEPKKLVRLRKMNLFGKAKKKETPKDSIMKLKETLSMLEKRESHLNKKIDAEIASAKANATKNKRAGML